MDEHGREGEVGGVEDEGGLRETTTAPPRAAEDSVPSRRRLTLIIAFFCAGAVAGLVYLGYDARIRARLSKQAGRVQEAITEAIKPPADPYTEAVLKVEEDRGEDIGRKATAEVPAELKHYSESRRFMAVQEAATREASLKSPHDFAELAAWVKEGLLTEAPRLGRGYVLYGVGLAATGALTHYDAARGRSVPLFADDASLKSYTDELDKQRTQLGVELKELDEKLKAVGKKDKQAREQLNSDEKAKRKELTGVEDALKTLKLYYAAPKQRAALFAEYETLAALARDFGGRAYDLHDASASKEFQARMLTYVRPAALAVMEELGSAYQEKFGRPLPITSLIRTEEYQRTLREAGNANAGNFSVEPHTTGLAFDVYYHFMTAAEQQFVMDEIARLERGGRVEALRELRDHYHVFAFPGGVRPDDDLVDKVLKGRARDADDSKQKAATAKDKMTASQTKNSKEKPAARKTKAASAKTPARDKKGARRR
ncbi:MAG TPA: DUF5715 family protein [Pyrinomonadaceae bacterium]|jgi:hypothetical protein|nr:DUF5715 family protein [Pyrinomonadaceae bacterium]